MFIKICGIKTQKELKVVEKYADATGVVVESESKRRVSLDKAKELIEASSIPVFTVSTLEDFKSWSEVIEKTGTEYIQIHSDMDTDTVEKLKEEHSVFIMKAFKVPKRSSFPEMDAEDLIKRIVEYKGIVDRILLDTGKGCGVTHDHRVSKIVCRKFDVVLAGGLNPENVREIVDYVQPSGVDVSSGVERDGEKREELIKSFVERLKMR
ncbi:phosphoribosylanthranilate isomerase [Methanofervidicoccus abyssi]|uniref:N-(5'-phosphoribosyl)anthranilate isomerase n=1 Tax=Methanofervidicoccus abyssi TaxID=2082189 RepID=A0A401HPY8_9EURY|nr:phosphoribosylanthranilate isomerase [Methanofervidicoccus abyssi]GBF36334.1 phosphoribosylanthranilate isomerase [Methanofervidicoccus abyssi]